VARSGDGAVGGSIGMVKNGVQSITSKVSETLMPQVFGDGEEAVVDGRWRHRVQVAVRVTGQDDPPGSPILNRETTVVKFDSYRVMTTESFDRNKILQKVGGDENVT
jgi:hypothetical protein